VGRTELRARPVPREFRLDLIHPYPSRIRRGATAQPFLEKLERLLREQVDSDRIDREARSPTP